MPRDKSLEADNILNTLVRGVDSELYLKMKVKGKLDKHRPIMTRSKVAGKRDRGQRTVSAYLNVPFALYWHPHKKCDIPSYFQSSFVIIILGFGGGELSPTSVLLTIN